MPYGAKYKVAFSDVYQNTTQQYIATIYKKDYSDEVFDLDMTGSPLTIETDRTGDSSYRPIIASKATLSLLTVGDDVRFWEDINDNWESYVGLWNGNVLNIQEFFLANPDTFYLELTQKNELSTYDVKWKGWYVPSSDITFTDIKPMVFDLTFSDFALLNAAEFQVTATEREVSFNAIDRISLKDLLINSILNANLGYEIRVNFPYTMYKAGGNINSLGVAENVNLEYDNIYILKNALLNKLGEYKSYQRILTELCSQFGLMVYQANGYVYISSFDKLVNESSRVYKRYNGTTGTYIADVTETDSVVALNSSTFRNINRTQEIKLSLPYKSFDIISKAPITTNNINSYFNGYDLSRSMTQNKLVGWQYAPDTLRDPEQDRSIYSYDTGTGIIYRYGHKLTPYSGQTTIDENRNVTMTEELKVSVSDLISVSTNIYNDFYLVLDFPTSECFTRVYCTLKYKNLAGIDSFKYLKPDGTWTTTRDASNNLQNVDVKNVGIPNDGTVFLTILSPWTSGTTGDEALYLSWAVLQTYKGVIQDVEYNNATSKNSFDTAYNNKEIYSQDAISTFFNYELFDNYTSGTVGKAYSSIIGNILLDKYYDYIPDKNNLGNRYLQPEIGKSIQKNIGLINASIMGSYKSEFNQIGSKYSYTIESLPENNFILLDYKMDFKNASQDSILYSCEFTDDTSYTFENRIINEKQ